MYNRYIPEDESYTPVEPPAPAPRPPRPPERPSGSASVRLPDFLNLGGGSLSRLFSGGEGGGLSGLLKTLHLDRFDSGDVLLLLILLYLLVEGDDMELVIALGLALLMGLGEDS